MWFTGTTSAPTTVLGTHASFRIGAGGVMYRDKTFLTREVFLYNVLKVLASSSPGSWFDYKGRSGIWAVKIPK